MTDFEIFVDDDRYAVPSLYLISASSETKACTAALEIWRASVHHLGVELRRMGGGPVCLAGSPAA